MDLERTRRKELDDQYFKEKMSFESERDDLTLNVHELQRQLDNLKQQIGSDGSPLKKVGREGRSASPHTMVLFSRQ